MQGKGQERKMKRRGQEKKQKRKGRPEKKRQREGRGKEERALRLVLEQWISLRYRSGYR